MTHRYRTLPFLLLAVAVVVAGCDQSSLNNEPNYGDEYIITQNNSAMGDAVSGSFDGSTTNEDPTVTVPDTVDYFVEGYTTEKSYTWSLNDSDISSSDSPGSTYVWEDRDGEFITVYYDTEDPMANVDPTGSATNTLSVNSPDDDISAETLEITAVVPSLLEQINRLTGLATLSSSASSSTLATDYEDGGPFTVLAPGDSAFASLSAAPTQATDADEDTTSSVLGQILQYHTIDQDLSTDDISAGQTVTTELGDLEVTFGESDGTITVNDSADVSQSDIPVTEGALHRLDKVVLPPTALVDFTDRSLPDTSTTQGDTLVVDGTSFPEDGGFVVLHDQEELQNLGAIPSTVGVSEYVEPGINNGVKVALDEAVADTTTLVAMPHQDTDGDETYDFETSVGTQDGPYTLNGDAVTDPAVLNVFDPDN